MDSEYAYSGTAGPDCAKSPAALDSLQYLADSLNNSGARIEKFLARFHGAAPQPPETTKLAGVPSGHVGQLQRLQDAASKLENLTDKLTTVG